MKIFAITVFGFLSSLNLLAVDCMENQTLVLECNSVDEEGCNIASHVVVCADSNSNLSMTFDGKLLKDQVTVPVIAQARMGATTYTSAEKGKMSFSLTRM